MRLRDFKRKKRLAYEAERLTLESARLELRDQKRYERLVREAENLEKKRKPGRYVMTVSVTLRQKGTSIRKRQLNHHNPLLKICPRCGLERAG
jgi:hypothetical protein